MGKKDSVRETEKYCKDETLEVFEANRVLEITTEFNMKMINNIRTILNSSKAQTDIHVDYELSNDDEIRQELLTEALKNARLQAEVMAQAIDLKVVGLISADKNQPQKEMSFWSEVLCQSLACEQDVESYENSDELAPADKTYTETIHTTWEIS